MPELGNFSYCAGESFLLSLGSIMEGLPMRLLLQLISEQGRVFVCFVLYLSIFGRFHNLKFLK